MFSQGAVSKESKLHHPPPPPRVLESTGTCSLARSSPVVTPPDLGPPPLPSALSSSPCCKLEKGCSLITFAPLQDLCLPACTLGILTPRATGDRVEWQGGPLGRVLSGHSPSSPSSGSPARLSCATRVLLPSPGSTTWLDLLSPPWCSGQVHSHHHPPKGSFAAANPHCLGTLLHLCAHERAVQAQTSIPAQTRSSCTGACSEENKRLLLPQGWASGSSPAIFPGTPSTGFNVEMQ